MALGSTQTLTEMSTRSISWGKRRPVHKADNLPPSRAVVTKSGDFNFLVPSGPVPACNGTALPFYSTLLIIVCAKNIILSLFLFPLCLKLLKLDYDKEREGIKVTK